MHPSDTEIVVAGHICLDIIPTLSDAGAQSERLFQPGRLTRVGPAAVSLGGCVANTGLALQRMGARVRLIGKHGDDLLGKLLQDSLAQFSLQNSESMIVATGETTSYTIVVSPPGVDRGFLHCAGANDTFSARDIDGTLLAGARIVHFGYPPLMNSIAADGGWDLAAMFRQVQRDGGLSSLDMAMPDTTRPTPHVNWRRWLECVLPAVDLCLPSFDEVLLMLDPVLFEQLEKMAGGNNLAAAVDHGVLERLADELLGMGASIVLLKLGDQGLFLKTAKKLARDLGKRSKWENFDWRPWNDLQATCPCCAVDVRGTTGAGDCTIAGFLMALLRGRDPIQALRSATAVGALCVQSADATSNIPAWDEVERRAASLPRRSTSAHKFVPC